MIFAILLAGCASHQLKEIGINKCTPGIQIEDYKTPYSYLLALIECETE